LQHTKENKKKSSSLETTNQPQRPWSVKNGTRRIGRFGDNGTIIFFNFASKAATETKAKQFFTYSRSFLDVEKATRQKYTRGNEQQVRDT